MDKVLNSATHDVIPTRWIGLQLDLTTACTGKCVYCGHRTWPKAWLSQPEVEGIVSLAGLHGFSSVTLSGGSPQLHPGFWTTIAMAKSLKMGVNVFTDAIGLDFRRMTVRPDRLQISVDTPDAAVYARLRGVDKFDKVLIAVRQALTMGISVRLMATMTPGYIPSAMDLVRAVAGWRREWDAPLEVGVYLAHDMGGISTEQVVQAVTEVIADVGPASWHNLSSLVGSILSPSSKWKQCFVPYSHRVVAADGLVFGCCYADYDNMAWSEEVELARKENSMANGTGTEAFRKSLLTPTYARYHDVALGAPCTACQGVNSRYAVFNEAWNRQAAMGAAYI